MKKLLCLIMICLLLSSCRGGDGFDGGRPISKEELASLSAALLTNTAEPEEATRGQAEGFYLVFWTDGGSVYHMTMDCRHLKNAKSIRSGSIQAALDSGKGKACSVCGGE